jgi:hypothetical protein
MPTQNDKLMFLRSKRTSFFTYISHSCNLSLPFVTFIATAAQQSLIDHGAPSQVVTKSSAKRR